MKTLLVNWKTTAAAIGLIMMEVGKLLSGDTESFNWEAVLVAIGLLFSRDGDKTSEQVGAQR